ncbi:MAG: HD domain-containing protein [Thermosphaera sp.]
MNLSILEQLSRSLLGGDFDHGFPHVERVLNWAKRISFHEDLEVNWELLKTIVILHDLGRMVGEPHAYYSGLIAEELLGEMEAPPSFKRRVVNAILFHSFSYRRREKVNPESTEALVVSDADKLDALGVVGFLRVFLFSFKHGRSLEETLRHFEEKIFNLDSELFFNYSRTLAEELAARTKKLVGDLLSELSSNSLGKSDKGY